MPTGWGNNWAWKVISAHSGENYVGIDIRKSVASEVGPVFQATGDALPRNRREQVT